MTDVTWLVVLTIVEIIALVVVLTTFVVILTRQLRGVAELLGRIAFGVRAVERQAEPLRPSVERMDESLEALNGELVPRLTAGPADER